MELLLLQSAPQKYLACVMTTKAFHLKLARNHSIPTCSLVARVNDCKAKVSVTHTLQLVGDIHISLSRQTISHTPSLTFLEGEGWSGLIAYKVNKRCMLECTPLWFYLSYFSQFQCLCLTLLVIHAVYIHLWHKMFTFIFICGIHFIDFENALHYTIEQDKHAWT